MGEGEEHGQGEKIIPISSRVRFNKPNSDPAQDGANRERAADAWMAKQHAKEALDSYSRAVRFLKAHAGEITDEIDRFKRLKKEKLWIRTGDVKDVLQDDISDSLRDLFSMDYHTSKEPVYAAVVEWLRQKGRTPTLQTDSATNSVYLDFTQKADVPHR